MRLLLALEAMEVEAQLLEAVLLSARFSAPQGVHWGPQAKVDWAVVDQAGTFNHLVGVEVPQAVVAGARVRNLGTEAKGVIIVGSEVEAAGS